MFGELFISAFVAYGFARFNFPGKPFIFLLLITTIIIPYEVTMIPLYIIFANLGLLDTF